MHYVGNKSGPGRCTLCGAGIGRLEYIYAYSNPFNDLCIRCHKDEKEKATSMPPAPERNEENDLDRLLKLLSKTQDPNDPTALLAARKANEFLAKCGWTWEKLLRGKVTLVVNPFATTATPKVNVTPKTAPPPPTRPAPPYNPPPRTYACLDCGAQGIPAHQICHWQGRRVCQACHTRLSYVPPKRKPLSRAQLKKAGFDDLLKDVTT